MPQPASDAAARRRWTPALLLVVGLAAFFARLMTAPPGINGDAARLGVTAFDFLYEDLWPFYIYHQFAPHPLIVYLQAALFSAAGFTLAALRGLTAFIGALWVPVGYIVCRELFAGRGRRFAHRAGLVAAFGMALTPFLTDFAHLGTENPLLPLLELLTVAFVWRGVRSGRRTAFVLGGLALGLSQYSYIVARFWPLAFAAGMLAALLTRPRQVLARWRGLALSAGVAALVALPQWVLFVTEPYSFTARTGNEAGRFIFDMPRAGAIFVEKLLNQLLAIGWRWDTTYYFTDAPGRPLLNPVLLVLILAGAAVALLRREPGLRLVLAVLAVMLIPDLITYEGTVPSATRLVGAYPWLYVVCGVGGAALAGWLERRSTRLRAHAGTLVVLAVVLAGTAEQAVFGAVQVPRMMDRAGFEWRTSSVDIVEARLAGQHQGAKILIPSGEVQRAPLTFLLAEHYPARAGGVPVPLQPGERVTVIVPDDPTRPTTAGIPAWYVEDEWVLLADGVMTFLPPLPGSVQPDETAGRETFHAANGAVVAHVYEGTWAGVEPGMQPTQAAYQNGMRLAGYTLGEAAPGETLVVTLYWQVTEPLERDVEIFVQVLDAFEQYQAGIHTWPLHGAYRARAWEPGEIVPISYRLDLPETLEPGSYKVVAGVYDLLGREPIPTTDGAPYTTVAPVDVGAD